MNWQDVESIEDETLDQLKEAESELESLVVHLLDFGSIKLGTPHSAKLIDILRIITELKRRYEAVTW